MKILAKFKTNSCKIKTSNLRVQAKNNDMDIGLDENEVKFLQLHVKVHYCNKEFGYTYHIQCTRKKLILSLGF